MKWRSLLFLFTCMLLLIADSSQQKVTVQIIYGDFEFTCSKGKWNLVNNTEKLLLKNKDDDSGEYVCKLDEQNEKNEQTEILTVKFRTCETCIELDDTTLSAIVVGNILATALIGYAVYSITAQPKSKTFSGNKASDKVNLITNGEGDTYQRLTPGQSSEYSGLVGRKK